MEGPGIQKTCITIDGGGTLIACDTITYNGALWLVPEWLELQERGTYQPERAIRLDQFRYKESPGHPTFDYLLQETLPKGLVSGPSPHTLAKRYVVEMLPEIFLNLSGDH